MEPSLKQTCATSLALLAIAACGNPEPRPAVSPPPPAPAAETAPKVVSGKKIEASVRLGLGAKGVTLKSLSCPDGRPIKSGDTFDCAGVDQDDKALTFHVVQADNTGDVTWKMEGMIVDQTKIGDSIESKVGHAADVQCPAKIVIMKIGEAFTCPVLIEGKTRSVRMVLMNENGDVSWTTL